ncbi:hypothetical protein [Natronoglycomyces albus]|uniref:Uncharacterized protein n=1 Tax=Natronoglycomyces albus TaxID=2811108 RepID=A0A895XPB9_9ACTN|nr:hypothetical protein [Natronoglycomyces albus]QSB04925.1 hypothetical protein JQS30_14335 [Natronoglycomyces albus]
MSQQNHAPKKRSFGFVAGADHIVNVLLHDAGGDRPQTVEAVSIVVPHMIEQGYEFKALPNCL